MSLDPIASAGSGTHAPDAQAGAADRGLRGFVFALFFIFGGITSLNDVIIPKLKDLFTIGYGEALLVQSAFFAAYFLVSLPGAAIVRKALAKRKEDRFQTPTDMQDALAQYSYSRGLKVISRAEVLPGLKAAVVPYRVSMREGTRIVKEQATESSVTDQAVLHGGSDVCKSRTFTWAIPAGAHRIRFTETGAPGVLVRLMVSNASAASQTMISITPIEAPRTVTVSEGEKMIPYYSVLPGKPVRWRIVGPTRLELAARLDFDPTMRGPQVYRLAVVEEGKKPREYSFQTTKATTALYADLKDRVASKLDRIVVELGAGTHELSVVLRAPASGSAEIHARIPEPSTGEEE